MILLSRLLTAAEQRYWTTVLEIFCLVWTLKKVSHLVHSALQGKLAVIYTDYQATVSISQQKTLQSVSTESLNLRLVRASMFLQQFDFRVHRPGADNKVDKVTNALSLLPRRRNAPADQEHDLDYFCAITEQPAGLTTLQLSDDFKRHLRE